MIKSSSFTPSTPSDEYLDAEDSYEDDDIDDPMLAKLISSCAPSKDRSSLCFVCLWRW